MKKIIIRPTKLMFVFYIFLLIPVLNSCQTEKFYYTKYENLPLEKKQEVDIYVEAVKKEYPKNNNEISLMLGYECFLNQSVIINKTIKKEFPSIKNVNHYGMIIVNVEKEKGKKIELEFSDKKKIKITPKQNYDYISVCYNGKYKEWYIEYYDYPHLNPSE